MSKMTVRRSPSALMHPRAKNAFENPRTRLSFMDEFRREAVAMLLDGQSASSVADRLGIAAKLLCRWKTAQLNEPGPLANAIRAGLVLLVKQQRLRPAAEFGDLGSGLLIGRLTF